MALRMILRWSSSAAAYRSAPSSASRRVDPSMSVNRKVAVPLGRSAISGSVPAPLRFPRSGTSLRYLAHTPHSAVDVAGGPVREPARKPAAECGLVSESRAGVPLTNLDEPLFDGANATK